MHQLLVLAFVGFLAQLVDSALGMGYGITSMSLLLLYGLSPAAASASVNLAKIVTGAASAIAHWRFGNIDRHMVRPLALSGSAGAFTGAFFLANLPGEAIKPLLSAFLLVLGVHLLVRLFFAQPTDCPPHRPVLRRFLVPLGFFAGFANAVGGGGWGPITTPLLMLRRELEPRQVIGSVNTSEIAVALSAATGFALFIGFKPVHWLWVSTLMLGGIVAAPIAAWLVKVLTPRMLGAMVGGIILLTNSRSLLLALGVSEEVKMWAYGGLWVALVVVLAYALKETLAERRLHELLKGDYADEPVEVGYHQAAERSV